MITLNQHTTVEDIITDGEYNNDVKEYIVHELSLNDKLALTVFKEWLTEAEEMGNTEAVEYFKDMTDKEFLTYMDLNEIVDDYEEASLADFALGLDIDWTGLAESFGIE